MIPFLELIRLSRAPKRSTDQPDICSDCERSRTSELPFVRPLDRLPVRHMVNDSDTKAIRAMSITVRRTSICNARQTSLAVPDASRFGRTGGIWCAPCPSSPLPRPLHDPNGSCISAAINLRPSTWRVIVPGRSITTTPLVFRCCLIHA